MKLKYILHDDFKFWISNLANEGENPWNTEYYCYQMRELNDWFEEIEIQQSDSNEALYTFLDLGDNAELEEGNVKRGAFTYTVYKLIGGWQMLDAGMPVADLPLNDGDFLLIDSSFKPSRGVIATPRSARLPKNFSSYAGANRFFSFRAPFVQVCYTTESDSLGLQFRNNINPLEKLERAGFCVSLDEKKQPAKPGEHPYKLPNDPYRQLLFDALGWYNFTPHSPEEYIQQTPELKTILDNEFNAFLKVGFSNKRWEDPIKLLFISIGKDFQQTLTPLAYILENLNSLEYEQRKRLEEEIYATLPVMKLEKTASYHEMLDQITQQKAQGLISEEEARKISYTEAETQMASMLRDDLFYAACLREFGDKAFLLPVSI